jgi:hypothetical protein
MANHKRPLTPKQAWRLFEDAIRETDDISQVADWLRKHPQIARKMTGAGLLACFDEDSGLKKKSLT